MRFAFMVALSHLRGRRTAGVSAISLVSVIGVTVGVTALIMVLAVMEGFEIDLRNKILGSNAHVVVRNVDHNFADYGPVRDAVAGVPGVAGAAPFLYTEAMIQSRSAASGVLIKGIDLERTSEVTSLVENLTQGPMGQLHTDEERAAVLASLPHPPRSIFQQESDTIELPGLLLGEQLAKYLGSATGPLKVGDKVHIINPVGGGMGPMGAPVPHVRPFRVSGIFHSGMYEYDTKWTYVAMGDLQHFLKVGDKATGIEVRVDDINTVGLLKGLIEGELDPLFYAVHWKELNKSLFEALALEKVVMGLILSLIVMVASLNIVGMLILVVVTRSREISILRAMGASSGKIRAIFMLEGLLIGVVGTIFGTGLGLAGCELLRRYEFPLDTDVYYLDSLPVVVQYPTVGMVGLAAVGICFAATLYPATLAAGISPVDGLRFE
jgi:lipoprotein-releasing system permease protein